jgi:ATP-dependent RNA helicase SUPV3L1/SUV3
LTVRLDMLERLADLIREARASGEGAAPKGRFQPTPAMLNLIGAGPEDFRGVLRALGYRRLKTAADGGVFEELWARSRKPAPAEAPAAPAPAETPFAKLAELDFAAPARKPRPQRRPRKRRKAARS